MLNNSKTLYSSPQIIKRLSEITADILSKLPSTADEIILVPILEGAAAACGIISNIIQEKFGGCAPCTGAPEVKEKPILIKRSRGTELIPPELSQFNYSPDDFRGKFVVIIDDLVDEGETLKLAHSTIKGFAPAELTSIVLVKKTDIDTDGWLNYSCFEMGLTVEEARHTWLYGFGMDLNGQHRELDRIAAIKLKG